MRVMDLVCDVSNASLESVEYLFTEGWIDTLFEVTEFDFASPNNPDVLVGLNKMELLVKVCDLHHFLSFLRSTFGITCRN